jgi:hypothetical protein
MAQAIVDKAAPGVKVTFYESRHSQISRTGVITYGSTTVTNNVVFMLTKNQAYNKQIMKVVVPAQSGTATTTPGTGTTTPGTGSTTPGTGSTAPSTSQVNVKDYGAKGDGVTDDAAAIQNAANAAKTKKYTLYIPSGDYYLGKSISIYTSVNSQGRFVVKNSNVTFKNITLNNTSTSGSPEGGMYLVDCTDVTINNPVISGYFGSGDKYGICMGITANLVVDGGNIKDVRHGISGRHSKNVIIRNGTYAGTVSGVDNHWGNNFLVENCIINGNSGVSYAGTDITVRNCQLLNCINIFTLRNDTPEIAGKVVVENVTAKSPSNYSTMYCYRATYEGLVRDYGHKLAVPTITMRGIRAGIPSNGTLYYKQILAAYAADYTGKMTFSDIQTLNGGRLYRK